LRIGEIGLEQAGRAMARENRIATRRVLRYNKPVVLAGGGLRMITFISTFAIRCCQGAAPRACFCIVRARAAFVAVAVAGVVMAFGASSAVATTTTTASPAPHASLSPGSLSFSVEVNEFNQSTIDSNPATVTVTNTGTAPLSVSTVKIVNSTGGFVISNQCVSILVNDSFTSPCATPTAPLDTCNGATLAVGGSCGVSIEYTDAAQFATASGSLEIVSNSPTSPNLVSLSATSKFISSPLVSAGAVPGGCPGVINDGQNANPNVGGTVELGGCWASVGPGGPGATPNSTWGAVGPVTIDGDVTLFPTSASDELWVSPSILGGGHENNTIYATPSNAQYVVMVAPPPGSDPTTPPASTDLRRAESSDLRPGEPARTIDTNTLTVTAPCLPCEETTWAVAGPNTERLGLVDLGANPFVCVETGIAAGCHNPMFYGADSPPDVIHGLPILGGEIVFGGPPLTTFEPGAVCGGDSVNANAQLPSLFSSTSIAGSPPPTVTFFFAGCKPPPPPPPLSGPASAPVNCSGSLSTTPACGGPGGTIIPPTPPGAADTGSGGVHVGRLSVRFASNAAAGDPSCPSGDVDYTANAPESFVGAMDLGSPFLCYDPVRDVWTVGGKVGVLNASVDTGPPPNFGIGFHSNGAFDHGGIQAVNFNPELPLAPAVGLSSFGGLFSVDPTRLEANATVTVAGVLQINGGAFAVWANPTHPYTYEPNDIPGIASLQTDTQPPNQLTDFAAGIGGTVTLDLPVLGPIHLASGYVFYAAPSYFEFKGCLGDCASGLSLLGLATVFANVQGALDTGNGEFNVGGSAKVCADFPIVGQVCPLSLSLDASNEGLGACGSFLGITGGVIASGGGVQIEGGFSSSSCDLGPITVVVQRSRAVDPAIAHVAQAGGPVTLHLTGHPPSTSIYIKGTGGPPVLSLAGPSGQRLRESSAGHGVYNRSLGLVIWPEPKLNETLVSIDHPAPGAWSLTPVSGSPRISSISYANAIAPARITATVPGRGRTRTLSYRIVPRAGQRVKFVERAGRVFHGIGVARGAHGKLRFTSALGPGGRRAIVAEISVAGRPSAPVVVAHYNAPPPPRAGKASHLKLARRGRSLSIRWGKATNAGSYVCAVTLSDGKRVAYILPARLRSKLLSTVAPNVTGRISIIPLTAMGAAGPAITTRLNPVPAPARVTRLTITPVHGTVVVSWQRSSRASKYMLILKVVHPGATIYAPVLLHTTRFVSRQTLPDLPPGSLATVTVIGLGPTGAQSAASSVHYRAS
jgi:hypothetical protein